MTMQQVVQKKPLHTDKQSQDDLHFWQSQPIAERLAAVEFLRQQLEGKNAERRLQRVCHITQLKPG
jgi:hypothetical protein